jgi:hypothetical protein
VGTFWRLFPTANSAGNGNGRTLSKATVFAPGRTPVIGRFSLAGSNPHAADASSTARGLGLVFGFPGKEQWRMATEPSRLPGQFTTRLLRPADRFGRCPGHCQARSNRDGAVSSGTSANGTRYAHRQAATLPWPAGRRSVDAGLLTLDSVQTEARQAHSVVAYALVAAIAAHVSAVLLYTLTLRDRMIERMTFRLTRARSGPNEGRPA